MRAEYHYKLLAVERILNEKPQTAQQIIQRLNDEYGITAERESIYLNIAVLTRFMDIRYVPLKGYYIEKC